ncbi:MAG: sugar ABC transporter permease [Ardenticatenaceae bacterium]|nr:sugar ABC transporter permease [Anaerolineales bacterium]MCB8922726.1 sugar ABC transporter permease [Ardenticatenaceae bacterium]MCB9003569.1 sugar ABC transporter permease [Ardenticatenaceae bacterium]
MATQSATGPETAVNQRTLSIFTGRRGRTLKEVVLAYVLITPAFLIIFTFGIFPLAFSVYQSTLRGLNKIVGTYDGLGNYTKAIGNLAYVLGFWMAVIFLFLAVNALIKQTHVTKKYEERPWLFTIPGIVLAVGTALFVRFVYIILPEVLGISESLRAAKQAGSEETTAVLFKGFLAEIWQKPDIQRPFWTAVIIFLIAFALIYIFLRLLPRSPRNSSYIATFFQSTLLIIGALFLGWFTLTEVQAAYTAAAESGETLEIWTQTITISAGLVLLLLSWFIWRSANHQDSTAGTFIRLGAGSLLIIGAWVLIGELPAAALSGDDDWYLGLLNTVYYSVGSIPIQFAVSLMLATFLFQDIKGKSFFRMIFFLPYITPAVGAAASFRILFSGRVDAPINRIITAFGFEPLAWLNGSTGIFQMIAGDGVTLPTWAAGPSLSLVVIILFGVWTFIGFNTVILLAGLGAIPHELYEAASIDGGNRWSQFRHITLPLLSPTIYFLTLWAVIGTFKAFNHIYVLRTGAALGTADTASIVIFDAMKRDTRYGYAAALAVLLLIIVMGLTVINNRIASKRVFYG